MGTETKSQKQKKFLKLYDIVTKDILKLGGFCDIVGFRNLKFGIVVIFNM